MLKLDWTDIEAMADSLAEQIAAAHGPVDPGALLVGVSRGGLIPAALVAHRLGLRKVASLGLMSYADGPDGEQGALVDYGPAPDGAAIVIDDIIDTGRTLEAIRARYPDAVVGALVDKTEGRSGVISARQTPAGLWVAFPWESAEA
ncbi:MAG: phosphoribosyltransferase family protein [Oceanicaulis sp.]